VKFRHLQHCSGCFTHDEEPEDEVGAEGRLLAVVHVQGQVNEEDDTVKKNGGRIDTSIGFN
jgi:hypothetical protein